MQRAFDTRAVIRIELSCALVHVIDLAARDLGLTQNDLTIHKPDGGDSSQIQNDLEQIFAVVRLFHRMADIKREDIEQCIEVVCNLLFFSHRV